MRRAEPEQNRHHGQSPRRSTGTTRRPHRCGAGGHRVLHRRTRPRQRRPAGGVRHVRPSGVQPRRGVQRGAHPRDDAGHRRVPAAQGTTGPLFIGRDTHALSEPAWVSALEVLAANDVVAMIDSADRYTPTPAVSHAILTFNAAATAIWPTGSSSRLRTTRRATAASSTTRPTADPPTPTPPA